MRFRKYPKARVIAMSDEMSMSLESLSAERQMSISEIVREAISREIKRLGK
jgi:predicted DNA-binding protein